MPFYDRSELVETALGTVKGALLQGAVLVLLVLLFFMGQPAVGAAWWRCSCRWRPWRPSW